MSCLTPQQRWSWCAWQSYLSDALLPQAGASVACRDTTCFSPQAACGLPQPSRKLGTSPNVASLLREETG